MTQNSKRRKKTSLESFNDACYVRQAVKNGHEPLLIAEKLGITDSMVIYHLSNWATNPLMAALAKTEDALMALSEIHEQLFNRAKENTELLSQQGEILNYLATCRRYGYEQKLNEVLDMLSHRDDLQTILEHINQKNNA